MSLSLLDVCLFNGPALPEPFVQFELEKELTKLGLLSKTTGEEGKGLQSAWEVYRRHLRELAARGGPLRVRHCIIDPLVHLLGFDSIESSDEVKTREGLEEGGHLLRSRDGSARLRIWTTEFDEDLDAPARRGAAYRFSHLRIAQRVLLTTGERIGLLTNGTQLRVLLSDPARPDSEVVVPIESAWKRSREVPDSFRLVLAIGQPKGIQNLADLVEKARLQQVRVTKELRLQARRAIEQFVQELLDHPQNRVRFAEFEDKQVLAKDLWHEGLVLVYRLLFILKLETTDDGARSFRFTSSSLWRNTFSPSLALAPRVRDLLDHSEDTGNFLESGLRALFQMFTGGLECSELHVSPLGGALFGAEAAPLLDSLHWGDRAVASLLDQLLWTKSKAGQQRVHYGSLDVEDLGRVYESLLELEAGLSAERLCRLRRQKLEVVVPVAQGEQYKTQPAGGDEESDAEDGVDDTEPEEPPAKKTKTEWIEEIAPNRFYLRVGLGRKASGSYYTPHSFVRFLVLETLGPIVTERSPSHDPNPGAILKLKVLDPAMGSGHFLVEVCRFLGEKLYEACRLCDERATPAEVRAQSALDNTVRNEAAEEATKYRRRITDLPDPNNEIVQYLPSRAPEGGESGLSQRKALALCRRLIAVHCLYGVDKNKLAVELAKLALWIESHAEGMPLTFVDHRLVQGDSLTGASFSNLLTYPSNGSALDGLFAGGIQEALKSAMHEALLRAADLEASVGTTLSEVRAKESAKQRLDAALQPFRRIAASWTGRVMAQTGFDADYAEFASATLSGSNRSDPYEAAIPLAYDLSFPEVFYPEGKIDQRSGFDVIVGNPPWDRMLPADKEFFAAFDFSVLDAPTKGERTQVQTRLSEDPLIRKAHTNYLSQFRSDEHILDRNYRYQVVDIEGESTIGKQDAFRAFLERSSTLIRDGGVIGMVVPSAFHSNEGATGVRRLFLEQMALRCCYSFENRRKLFEIDSRFKFATIVARAGRTTDSFRCAFYLRDDDWLFREDKPGELVYSLDFVRRTGGVYLSLLELRSHADLEIAEVCFHKNRLFGDVVRQAGVDLGRELNMSDDSWRFEPVERVVPIGRDPRDPDVLLDMVNKGYLLLHEGKTFHQFTDHWEDRPRHVVPLSRLNDKPDWIRAAAHYRIVFRKIASSTNERTAICGLISGAVVGDSANVDRNPSNRDEAGALQCLGVANTFSFDWNVRLKASANVNLFILFSAPWPDLPSVDSFIVHTSVRLLALHEGFSILWGTHFRTEWREETPVRSWPAIGDEKQRWRVRSALDAYVAVLYGITREQYRLILGAFSHKSFAYVPEMCLQSFDEYFRLGRDAFVRLHDPYWDVPLHHGSPTPVFSIAPDVAATTESSAFTLSSPESRGRRKRK